MGYRRNVNARITRGVFGQETRGKAAEGVGYASKQRRSLRLRVSLRISVHGTFLVQLHPNWCIPHEPSWIRFSESDLKHVLVYREGESMELSAFCMPFCQNS